MGSSDSAVLTFNNISSQLPTLQIDLTKCIGEEVKLAERAICSRPRTLQVEVIAKGINSCSSSGISSYKDSDSHNQNSDQQPSSSQGQSQQQPPRSPSQSQQSEHTRNYLLSVDTPNELKMWLNELNRVVKFLKEWKI